MKILIDMNLSPEWVVVLPSTELLRFIGPKLETRAQKTQC
jgi:predicted nuclease of predicted toxin-antitoxin system